MRALVTGAGGFVGPFLIDALMRRGHEVHGVVRRPPGPRLSALRVALHTADLCDAHAQSALLADVRPDAVVHLAGMAITATAEADPDEAYRVNLGGTLALLRALRETSHGARLLFVGSSEEYGAVDEPGQPITEDVPLQPTTVYGASKAAAEIAAAQWARAYGLDVVRVRAFNHTGPGQAPAFVCSAVARQIARIDAGLQDPVLQVGNLDPVRDFSDVRDVVAGYVAVLEAGQSGAVYNLCSGRGLRIAEVIDLLRGHARVGVEVRSEPARSRRADAPRIVGSHERATATVGWQPRIPFATTLGDLLADWRTRVAAIEASA